MFYSKKVWVIVDEIAGNANQAIAVAKALGYSYEIKKIKYKFWSFLPNWLKLGFTGINLEDSSDFNEPYPDIIISSGRRTAVIAAQLKKKSPQIFAVHLMNPDMCFSKFDLVCLPQHDKGMLTRSKNIIYTIGAPCYLDQDLMKKKFLEFSHKIKGFSKPFVCLMIGGKTKYGDYSLEELESLVQQATILTSKVNGSLLITTSRRTNSRFVAESLNESKIPYFFFDWQMMDFNDNPYLAYLKMSDYFIITGDSISICSEALSTGKPTYVYRKNNLLSRKHQKFLDYLSQLGYIKFLEENTEILEDWNYDSLNEAERISLIIKEKLQS